MFCRIIKFRKKRLTYLKCNDKIFKRCRSGGMADASDSKSDVGDYVWVQVPSPALYISEESWIDGFFRFFYFKTK